MNATLSKQPIAISCIIITKDEADRIEPIIAAAWKVADEIVVVDSGSTDQTVSLCTKLGCRVFHNDWVGYGPQKRFAEDQADHDWIINLDADEELSDALIVEILQWKNQIKPSQDGYRFKIVSVYPGRTRPRLWADHNNCLRLYDKRTMRFPDSLVFDAIVPGDRPVGQFKQPCWHYSMRSLGHMVAKLDAYSTLQAKEIKRPAWKILPRLPIEYLTQFSKYMILRRHVTGGLFGLKFSHEIAKSKVNRLIKMLPNGNRGKT
jgi:glycosyltransferase involved in cell wall biosynthesis